MARPEPIDGLDRLEADALASHGKIWEGPTVASVAGTRRARERFLGSLTPPMRRQVLWLSTRLNSQTGRNVLFTARKAACLADALTQLGLLLPNVRHTSTRVLDGDRSFLNDEPLTIVEDIVSSGRNLRETLRKLDGLRLPDVDILALSVEGPDNADYLGEVLRREHNGLKFHANLVATPDENLRHVDSLVEAFHNLPQPYNVDWPIHRTTMPMNRWPRSITDLHAVDRNPDDLHPFNLVPNAADLARLSEIVGLDLRDKLEISKIRIYPIGHPDPGGTAAFLVPIALPEGLGDPEALSSIYSVVAKRIGMPLGHNATDHEKYRALQYLLSEALLWASLPSSLKTVANHPRAAQMLFAKNSRSSILQSLHQIRNHSLSAQRRRPRGSHGLPIHISFPDSTVLGELQGRQVAASVLNSLTAEFRDGYEATIEFQLRQKRYRTEDPELQRVLTDKIVHLDRSATGSAYSAGDLAALAERRVATIAPSANEVREAVSAFIDQGIDSGAVVPELGYSNGVLARRFRAGEIVQFEGDLIAACEQALISFVETLASLKGSTGNPDPDAARSSIGADTVQKLIVGLIKVLLKQDQIHDVRAQERFNLSGAFLEMRYHIRGEVLTDQAETFVAPEDGGADDEFVAADRVPTSTQRLLDEHVLTQNELGTGYILADEPVYQGREGKHALMAWQYGRLVGYLFGAESPDGARVLTTDTFPLLVTLTGDSERVLAIGADLAIARNIARRHDGKPRGKAFNDLRQAVSKGLEKLAWLDSGAASDLLLDIRACADRPTSMGLPPLDPSVRFAANELLNAVGGSPLEGNVSGLLARLAERLRSWHIWCISYQILHDGNSSTEVAQRLNSPDFVELIRYRQLGKCAPLLQILQRIAEGEEVPGGFREALDEAYVEINRQSDASINECLQRWAGDGGIPVQKSWGKCLLILDDFEWSEDELDEVLDDFEVKASYLVSQSDRDQSSAPRPEQLVRAMVQLGSGFGREDVARFSRVMAQQRPVATALMMAPLPATWSPRRMNDRWLLAPAIAELAQDLNSIDDASGIPVAWSARTRPREFVDASCRNHIHQDIPLEYTYSGYPVDVNPLPFGDDPNAVY